MASPSLVAMLFVIAGCGSRTTPQQQAGGSGSASSGNAGAVCRCHARNASICHATPCQTGLVCGYPCGIDGCDSVCMTPENFERSHTMP